MRIRGAELRDAPALGHLVVESWLAAHRGQVPDAAWQKRLDEWTPEVSGRAWARLLGDRIDGNHDRTVLLSPRRVDSPDSPRQSGDAGSR